MIKNIRFCFGLLLLCLTFSACWMPQNSSAPGVQIAGGNQVWFDAPLNGMNLGLNQPYEIVMHAYSTSQITELELKANQTLLGNLPKPGSQGNLVTFKYTWTPTAAGNYTLTARAKDGNGNWGGYASTVITVGEHTPTLVVSFTPTQVVSFTPTQVVSFTPTQVVSFTPTQVNSFTPTPVLSFTRTYSTNLFYYGTCSPNSITITAKVTDPNSVYSVVLFQKLQSQSQVEDWDDGTAMTSLGNGSYSTTISGNSVPNHSSYQIAHWVYQLVATNKTGQVVGRSQTYYDDADLSACVAQRQVNTSTPVSFVRPPVIMIKTLTPTKIIIK